MAAPDYIEKAVVAALKADAGFMAICGGRVYALKMPQGFDLPSVVYRRANTSPDMTFQGYSSEFVYLTVNSYAEDYGEAKSLALEVRRVLAGIGGSLQNETDIYEDGADACCISAEFLFHQIGGYDNG